jgi:predicted class III extradiol MEMO1 family dioxygenase
MTGKTNIKTGHSTEKEISYIRKMKLKEVSILPLVISQKRQRSTTESGRERFARERE